MNDQRYQTLLQSLDRSIELLAELRTPDATCVAAFDTLKQARAMVVRAFEDSALAFPLPEQTANAA